MLATLSEEDAKISAEIDLQKWAVGLEQTIIARLPSVEMQSIDMRSMTLNDLEYQRGSTLLLYLENKDRIASFDSEDVISHIHWSKAASRSLRMKSTTKNLTSAIIRFDNIFAANDAIENGLIWRGKLYKCRSREIPFWCDVCLQWTHRESNRYMANYLIYAGIQSTASGKRPRDWCSNCGKAVDVARTLSPECATRKHEIKGIKYETRPYLLKIATATETESDIEFDAAGFQALGPDRMTTPDIESTASSGIRSLSDFESGPPGVWGKARENAERNDLYFDPDAPIGAHELPSNGYSEDDPSSAYLIRTRPLLAVDKCRGTKRKRPELNTGTGTLCVDEARVIPTLNGQRVRKKYRRPRGS